MPLKICGLFAKCFALYLIRTMKPEEAPEHRQRIDFLVKTFDQGNYKSVSEIRKFVDIALEEYIAM